MSLNKELYNFKKDTKTLINEIANESNVILEINNYKQFASRSDLSHKVISNYFATESLLRDLGTLTKQSIMKMIKYLLELFNKAINFIKNLKVKNVLNNIKYIFASGIDSNDPDHQSFIISFANYCQYLTFINKIESIKDLRELSSLKMDPVNNINDIEKSIKDILQRGKLLILNINGFNEVINEIRESVNNNMYLQTSDREYIIKGYNAIDNINNNIEDSIHKLLNSNKNNIVELSELSLLTQDKSYIPELLEYFQNVTEQGNDTVRKILSNMSELISDIDKKIKTLNIDNGNEKEMLNTYNTYIMFIKKISKVLLDFYNYGISCLNKLQNVTAKYKTKKA